MRDELNCEYFDWMYRLVCGEQTLKHVSYRKLLLYLHSRDFAFSIAMDGNRAEDGTDLRYRFGYERGLEGPVIASCLDDRPCSILEMMLALSIRCEEHIMDNPEIGDRTGQWFWNMVDNLGLASMTDEKFDVKRTGQIIDRFLDRDYERDGKGGLFTVKHARYDMRTTEIWYQAMWYFDEVLNLR